MSEQKQVTIKVWKSTRQKMRMAHAITGEPMCVITDRLFDAELDTLHAQGEAEHGTGRSELESHPQDRAKA